MTQKTFLERLSSKKVEVLFHILFWLIFYTYLVFDAYFENTLSIVLEDSLFYFIITAILVYANILFLVPKFLYEKKYITYSLCVLLLLLMGAAYKDYFYTIILPSHEMEDHRIYLFFNWFFQTLFELAGISSIKIVHDRILTKDRLQRAKKQRYKAELNFLKAQVNPHFLFNTLNNIFFLIKKDPEKASTSVLKLSEMLRFRLYEIGNSKIPIEKEIEYIRNYIELEKLRSEDKVSVQFLVTGDTHARQIEPFVFLDFVENAFKHNGAEVEKKGYINILFNIDDKRIAFQIENSKNGLQKKSNNKGIGIQNIRQRLNLVYQKKHLLTINETPDTHTVNLTIEL